MYYPKIKQKAIDLRTKGYSYSHIIKQTKVAKSTLSDWLQDIPFTPNKYTIETIGNARVASGKYKHQIRVKSLERAKLQAEKDIKSLSKRDIMMLGLGVYIGEGSKTAGITRISNSDPKIIKLTMEWLEVSFGVKNNQFKIRLHLYPDNNEKESVKYWSKHTGVPENQFFKSTIDKRIDKKFNNKSKLPFGTAHLGIKGFGDEKYGVYLHRLIMAWINRVLC
ncbi:MAG: hypothetical protein ABL899_02545 [Nitrospira sp.]